MSEAITFFNDESIGKEKCKYLAEEHSRSLVWEQEATSLYSPKIVDDDETVARQIHSPHSYDKETEKLTTLAFDDMFNKGLSTNRLSLVCSIGELHNIGEKKAEKARETNPKREYIGLSISEVKKIRDCHEGNERWFTVHDTSLHNDISHADVCCIYPSRKFVGKAERKGINRRQRELIQKVFSKVIKPQ